MKALAANRGRNPPEERKFGWILEVDLEYPLELHEAHNSYPLAREKKAVQKEWLSPFQNNLIESHSLNPLYSDTESLLLEFET